MCEYWRRGFVGEKGLEQLAKQRSSCCEFFISLDKERQFATAASQNGLSTKNEGCQWKGTEDGSDARKRSKVNSRDRREVPGRTLAYGSLLVCSLWLRRFPNHSEYPNGLKDTLPLYHRNHTIPRTSNLRIYSLVVQCELKTTASCCNPTWKIKFSIRYLKKDKPNPAHKYLLQFVFLQFESYSYVFLCYIRMVFTFVLSK